MDEGEAGEAEGVAVPAVAAADGLESESRRRSQGTRLRSMRTTAFTAYIAGCSTSRGQHQQGRRHEHTAGEGRLS